MSAPLHLDEVQRIVLHGAVWKEARHVVLDFGKRPDKAPPSPLHFLSRLHELESCRPTPAGAERGRTPQRQISLGFSRRGLERAHLPKHVLACFALKAPAFYAGAALRANRYLGAVGDEGPEAWDEAFDFMALDAVLSVHALKEGLADETVERLRALAHDSGVRIVDVLGAASLSGDGDAPKRGQWVHFGYLDGLSRIGIEGRTSRAGLEQCKPSSRHQAGEFVLGHVQDSGANPWIIGPQARVLPQKLREFFHNGSFGVLHKVEQYVEAFESFVKTKAEEHGLEVDEVKAKLCGRYPDGRPLASVSDVADADAEARLDITADFDYEQDPKGHRCPFGSHIRRMNPRGDAFAHQGRTRALMRRGMPYVKPPPTGATRDERGLMAQFFCTSIEEQFEHLMGQWADRVPLGSADRGGARDPLIGAHEPRDGPFEIPRDGKRSLWLEGLTAFTRNRGTAYLFYPSVTVLKDMTKNLPWLDLEEDDE